MGKFTIPLITTTERNAIIPEAGEVVYDETDEFMYFGNGSVAGGLKADGSGENSINSNAGSSSDGLGLVKSQVGVDTPIKRIKNGSNVSITSQTDGITISSSTRVARVVEFFSGTNTDVVSTTGVNFSFPTALKNTFVIPSSGYVPFIVNGFIINSNSNTFSVDSGGELVMLQAGRYRVQTTVICLMGPIFGDATTPDGNDVFAIGYAGLAIIRSSSAVEVYPSFRNRVASNAGTDNFGANVMGTGGDGSVTMTLDFIVDLEANDKLGLTSAYSCDHDTANGSSSSNRFRLNSALHVTKLS